MKSPMHLTQSRAGDMGVDFGCRDAGVAEELLDDAQVRPVVQEMGCEAMPEHVGRHIAVDARAADALFDMLP